MEEGLTSLVNGDCRLTRADLATLGWETCALILWIRENLIPSLSNPPFRFTRDMIQCGNCSSSLASELNTECNYCDLPLDGIGEHTVSVNSLLQATSGTIDPLVKLEDICCSACNRRFYIKSIRCPSCQCSSKSNVKIALKKRMDEKISEIFGEEIREYKQEGGETELGINDQA